ncbi:MAG: phosphoribosylaminoimidazolesuccinocarboxamide synthase [candidate division KSB1 bacterium]|nr:phosphoribosylaminoimidazolesuccinocarboxamide synthase [candidate division KSB1 bacterium]MDZ7366194.1 phosphoribosylaminoimidazolesuccinocarboxamide synthase [candidate division KSB1 bacterium]MDZ7404412.1 phosphoribosylaminoimidazolesuccinocarboxamide synthase [candidate division KSB1 bacterium]
MSRSRQTKSVITSTDFPTLKLLKRGKVRDVYEVGNYLLIVATDRLSAFDVVFAQGIPFKGRVLTQLSRFWFEKMRDIIPHHLISINLEEFPKECEPYHEVLAGRSMLVKKTEPLPVECIVRGYLSGSGWNEYQKTGAVCGIQLPPGLVESQKLPEPIFTPSTKAATGIHDENITFERAAVLVGVGVANELREKSRRIYQRAAAIAEPKGLIIADTKMEFGLRGGEMLLIDELLTPDSSRFWPQDKYRPGRAQESYDKQYVRDYLISINWNKQPPAPDLPAEVILTTSQKYLEALEKLTGEPLKES